MAKETRYYSEEDSIGVTPSQLKRLGKARQIEYIKFWFGTYFEDPVQGMPWVEGEYIYPFGGPYDANGVVQQEFNGIVSFDRMEEAIQEIEGDGTSDWAPTSRHPDYQSWMDDEEPPYDAGPSQKTIEEILNRLRSGEPVRLGSAEELFERQVLREHVAKLEAALARIRSVPPGRGHNGPPNDEDEEGGGPKPSLADAVSAVAVIKAEIELPTPDVEKVAEATSRLSRFAKWIVKRTEKVIEKAVETAIAWGPKVCLTEAVNHGIPFVAPLIQNVEATVIRWAEIAMAAF